MRLRIETSAPASRSAQIAARAEPPAPRTSARRPVRGSPIAAVIALASVLSAAITPSAKLSVFAAPIARAAPEAASATASAASLCGTVTLTPAKPAPGSDRTRSAKFSGATSIAS